MDKKVTINDLILRILLLYSSNYKNKMHIREIAKILSKPHRTIILNIKKLEDLNIVTSKIKGRNKEYSLNLKNQLTKNFIILAENFNTANFLESHFNIKKMVSSLESDLIIENPLVIFGSYAKGNQTKDSDIDLMSFGKLDIKKVSKIGDIIGSKINMKITTNYGAKLNKKDNLMIEVVKNHIILKNAEQFVDFLWRASQ